MNLREMLHSLHVEISNKKHQKSSGMGNNFQIVCEYTVLFIVVAILLPL